MNEHHDFLRMPIWYPVLAGHTFLTSFVKMRSDVIAALAAGETGELEKDFAVRSIIEDLRQPLGAIPGNAFVCVDTCAPTDTPRFEGKRGAVFSAESTWKYLAMSPKIRAAAERGEAEYICLRPFRRMNRTREFRLFIYEGKLNAMSQYHLIRHFRRLEGVRNRFWEEAADFVDKVAWLLPIKTLVMDIYFTSSGKILILDLNPWGSPTDPLLVRDWNRDWSQPAGMLLMPPPTRISGDVSVSF